MSFFFFQILEFDFILSFNPFQPLNDEEDPQFITLIKNTDPVVNHLSFFKL